MKKILLIATLCCFCLTASAQGNSIVETTVEATLPSRSTTMEEYNYLSKGLKTQIEQGLDMKRGYVFKGEHTFDDGNYNIQMKDLIRERDGTLAGISIILKRKGASTPIYIGLPNFPEPTADASEIYAKSFSSFNNSSMSSEFKNAILLALYLRSTVLTDAKYLTIKR